MKRISAALPCIILLLALQAAAQTSSAQSSATAFTLDSAVAYALAHYPSVRAALERQAAGKAEIKLAQTNYLPRADLLWQGNRATHNNFFGLLLPQSVVPPISGAVLPAATNANAWDSAAGVFVSWQPFDFGYRGAVVSAARASEQAATAGVAITRLDVASATASAFFNLLAAHESVRATQSDVDRRQVFANVVRVLGDNQLRPGADVSRSNAELAAARIRLIQAHTNERVATAAFADLLGVPSSSINIDGGPLLQVPPQAAAPSAPLTSHPAVLLQEAREQIDSAQLREIARSYFPQTYLQSSVSGRSSGVNPDGTVQGGLNGLNLNRGNWAVGVTVTFPVMDVFAIRARKESAAAQLRAERATYDQTVQDLASRVEQSRTAAEGAREIAMNTPIELQAAVDVETQARARYQSGLASILEVADAQALLAQAELSDALAKLNAWGSLASLSVAQGDLEPLLQLVRGAGSK